MQAESLVGYASKTKLVVSPTNAFFSPLNPNMAQPKCHPYLSPSLSAACDTKGTTGHTSCHAISPTYSHGHM